MGARRWASATLSLSLAATCVLGAGCEAPERHRKPAPPASSAEDHVAIEPRTPLLITFPCSRCHQHRTTNPTQRLLTEFHTARNKELHHGDAKGWCYHCHSETNIDRLVTASGKLVTFDEAYLLCGSCHGDKLRDWQLQIHGKTMGNWRGDKVRRSCTGCHSPHNPKFVALEPEKPPVPPDKVGHM